MPSTLSLADAAEAAGLSIDDLRGELDRIAAHPGMMRDQETRKVIGVYLAVGEGAVGRQSEYRPWAVSMGWWRPYRGRRLIGYRGIAWRTGRSVQWIRALNERARKARYEPMPQAVLQTFKVEPEGPGEYVRYVSLKVRDLDRTLDWAVRNGLLMPDRVTPRKRR